MKIAILGDLHFGVRNDSHVFLEYQRKFFDNIFFPTLEERGIEYHIQLGDIMDKRQSVNFHTYNQVKRMYFDECERRGIGGITLIGNHDIYWRQSVAVNSWNELFASQYEYFDGVTKPVTVKLGSARCDIIPWICDENEDEIFSFIENSTSDYLFGHLELSGFPMLRGVTSDHGHSKSIFKNYKRVFSGHYHTYSDRANVIFTGTPYELTWADSGDQKFFFIWDTETGDIEKIPNPYSLFHKIIYNDKENDYSNFNFDAYKHSYIRIIVQEKEDEKVFDNFIKSIFKKAEPNDVQITDVTLAYRDVDIESIETQDPLNVMVKAIDESDAIDDELKKRVRRDAMNIHTEAIASGEASS